MDRLHRASESVAPRFHEAWEVAKTRSARTELAPRAVPSASVQRLANRPSDGALGAGMDEALRRMQGPYEIDGRTVQVAAGFQSMHGVSAEEQQARHAAIKKEIGGERFREIAQHVLAATSTRGTPEDVRITTQALIDAGAAKKVMDANPRLSPEQAIRVVMASLGIGFDCRGYVFRSFLQARGTGSVAAKPSAYFEKDAGNELFHMDIRLRHVSSDLSLARTGDIIRLMPDKDRRDHNVIVRSNEMRDIPKSGTITVAGKSVPESFLTQGWPPGAAAKVRVLTIDSSWGGNGHPLLGGAERRVWLHNEKSGLWGFWDSVGSFNVSEKPYNHVVDSVLRPRSEP